MATAVIYTGGTIGCVGNPLQPLAASAFYTQTKQLWATYAVQSADCFALPVMDSSQHQLADWLAIARCIEQLDPKYHKVVLLHGTDTLTYTSAFLALALHATARSIVLVGGLQPLLQGGQIDKASDAFTNLHYSLSTAVPVGVWVANGSAYIAGHCAHKIQTNSQPVFAASGLALGYAHCVAEHSNAALLTQLSQRPAGQVAAIRWLPSEYACVAALSNALTYADAVIIESLGNGNGLTSPAIEQRVMDAANAGKMMILSSQVPQHLLDSSYASGLLNSSMASSLLPSYNWPFSALYVRALVVASLYPAQDRAERWQCWV